MDYVNITPFVLFNKTVLSKIKDKKQTERCIVDKYVHYLYIYM